jgi:hypothetical protein
MIRVLVRSLVLPVCLALLVVVMGCSEENSNEAGMKPPPGTGGPGMAGPAPAGKAASNPQLKEIMTKIGKGPQALQGSLGEALKQAPPTWDVIQGKAKEYALLTAELGKHDPVKGTKDSWAKLTKTFSESAAALNQEAQGKDPQKTQVALDALGNSCMSCHREHRIMGPPGGGMGRGGMGPGGPGGMGMPPGGGFRPPGGGGGPGGPPPPSGKPASETKAN